MKRKRDPENKELLPAKHLHIGDDKGEEEAISDSSEDTLVGTPLSSHSSDTDEAFGSEQQIQEQLPSLYDPFNSIIFKYLSDKDVANFAGACKQTLGWASDELEKRKASASLLAVVQGNEAKVKRIIEINLDLLYDARGKATDFSKRLIQGLTLFQAALCAGDVEMCEMMKDYFAQLEDGQAEMKKQFKAIFPNGVEAQARTQQDNVFDFDEIVHAIMQAPEDEVAAALNKAFDNNLPLHQALEKFRKDFTDKSLSETVFNPYHLLRALEMYDAKIGNFGNWNKRDLFWRQVIGFVQRYLPACYFQAFAQGIYYIVEEKEPLQRSFNFRWGSGSILPAEDFSGLGFDFAAPRDGPGAERQRDYGHAARSLVDYVLSNNIKLGEIIQPDLAVQTRTWCTIL